MKPSLITLISSFLDSQNHVCVYESQTSTRQSGFGLTALCLFCSSWYFMYISWFLLCCRAEICSLLYCTSGSYSILYISLKFIHSAIYSVIQKYLWNTYHVSGTVVGSGDRKVSRTKSVVCYHGTEGLVEVNRL